TRRKLRTRTPDAIAGLTNIGRWSDALDPRLVALLPLDPTGYGSAMSDVFGGAASIDYPIIDADAHVNEPPDTWQSRVPARLRNRAPKVLRTETGDVWSFDDGKRLRPLGLTATAGLSYPQFKAEGFRYEDIRPGSYDTKARLA